MAIFTTGLVACEGVEPVGLGEGCHVVGLTTDDGEPVAHYERQHDAAGLLSWEERRVHGAELASHSDFLYAEGRLVHQRDDTDGDGRIERVVDWVRDAEGQVLERVEDDRVSGRSLSVTQRFERGEVVERIERVDGLLLTEEYVQLDVDGRPVSQVAYDASGFELSRWQTTYDGPAPSLDRHRVGWLSGSLVTDADEQFDAGGRLVHQEGLVDGYQRVVTASFDATGRPLEHTLSYGELQTIATWTYEGEQLVEEREELLAQGNVIDALVTVWSWQCP
jgi:hypothetical protein